MQSLFDIILKIILSVILGGLVGIEREMKQKPAGFRTNILICLGATIIMVVSLELSDLYGDMVDPTRIAAQVITGIGFIGAGAIIRAGGSVQGLTTAASIWVTAGIGLAVGNGFYMIAVSGTLAVMIILNLGARFEQKLKSGSSLCSYRITGSDARIIFDAMKKIKDISISKIEEMKIEKADNKVRLYITFREKNSIQSEFIEEIAKSDGIEEVKLL